MNCHNINNRRHIAYTKHNANCSKKETEEVYEEIIIF